MARIRFLEGITYRPVPLYGIPLGLGLNRSFYGQSINIALLRSGQIKPISYRLLSPVRDETFLAFAKKRR